MKSIADFMTAKETKNAKTPRLCFRVNFVSFAVENCLGQMESLSTA